MEHFCQQRHTTTDDVLIILGDAGINYYGDWRDERLKMWLSNLPITLLCIHGNHEIRPYNIETYGIVKFYGSFCWAEAAHPNILFAMDGCVYTFCDRECLVIGGAYSVDKYYRLNNGLRWFDDEQPSEEIKQLVELAVEKCPDISIVLSHTCPYKYIPTEMFIGSLDQTTVDNSTEKWLDTIEETVDYDRWYCGHYHTDKKIDRMRFMFNDFELLTTT